MKSKSVLTMLDPLSLPRLEAILAYAREHAWAVILEDRLPVDGLGRIDGALVSLRGRPEQLDKVKVLQKPSVRRRRPRRSVSRVRRSITSSRPSSDIRSEPRF